MRSVTDQTWLLLLPGDTARYAFGDGAGAVALAKQAGVIAADIETGGLDVRRWNVKAVSLGTGHLVHVLDPDTDALAIRDAFAVATSITFHNAAFDVPILVQAGLMRPADVSKVHDTLIDARLADPGVTVRKTLGDTAERYLGDGYAFAKNALELGFKQVTGLTKAEMFATLGLGDPAYRAYAAFDVVMTARLLDVLPAAVAYRMTSHPYRSLPDPDVTHLRHREQTVNRMLLVRSCKGIEIDFDALDEIRALLIDQVAQADMLLAAAGIDVDLGQVKAREAVVDLLDAQGRLPSTWPRLKNRRPTTRKNWMEQLEHPLADAIRSRGEATHFLDGYAEKVLAVSRNGRIHPQVNVLAATTGRMSYGSPPLQQYPAAVRRMMRGDTDVTSLDWASIEPVLAAYLAHDVPAIEDWEAGTDFYEPVADAAGVSRKVAKVVLLALLYGQGVAALALRLEISVDEARMVRGRVMGRLPAVARMIDRVRRVGDVNGVVVTMSGRVVPLERDPETGGRRFLGYRGPNYLIQGSAYDVMAEAMYAMHREDLDDALLVAVHDELVVDTAAADDVARIMQTPPPALVSAAGRVPVLRVGRNDLGRNWTGKE